MLAEFLRDLGAVHVGHADIQQNQMRLVFQGGGAPASPVEGRADVMSSAACRGDDGQRSALFTSVRACSDPGRAATAA